MTDRFLLDTVTLSKMTASQRRSRFVSAYCQVPEEILFEARGIPERESLVAVESPTTIEVLANARAVMATLEAGDKLVDLYRNNGNGDVMLLATALAEMAVTQEQLFSDVWIIATDDRGLRQKAEELGIAVCDSSTLVARLAAHE